MSISERDFFWKTISVFVVIILIVMFIFSNFILASNFYIHNNFTDYKNPVSANWDTSKMEAGQSPSLKIEFEPDDKGQERFYDYFSIPESLRINLTFINVTILILLLGIFYVISISNIVRDDEIENIILFWTIIVLQIALLLGLFVSSIFCHENPDLLALGINDVQMSERANGIVTEYKFISFGLMFISFVVSDLLIVFLASFIVDFFSALAKKIKSTIIDKITLGNNIMLCCNNAVFELISIDFELKFVPFPALFLKKRVLDRFTASDNSPRRFREWLGDLSVTIEEEHIKKLSQLNMNGGSLLISPDDSVSIVRLGSALEWRPFPQTVVHEEVISRVTFDNFFRCLVADSKQVALEELKGMLVDSYKKRFETVGKKASLDLVNGICDRTFQVLKKMAPQLANEQKNSAAKHAADILQRLTDEKLEAFKQEIVAHIQESLEVRMSNNIKNRILAPLRDILSEQLPLINSHGSIDALPEGAKFFFSHGDRQIVIVEQKPQMRSLDFRNGFTGGGGRYNLALPYVIFLIIFRNQEFEKLHLYYANKPMSSLDSEVFTSNLPNINSGENSVCTGFTGCRASSLAGRVEEVIAHFWQSQFNNDLNHNYCAMARRGGAFRNLSTWEKASQGDQLFVLRVDWDECSSDYAPSNVVSRYMSGSITSKITNFDHIISMALQSDGMNIGAIARQCCESIVIDKTYYRKNINALKEQLVILIQEVCRSFEKTLSSEINSNNRKSLTESIVKTTAKAVEEVIAEDFTRCANQVLLRRRIDSQELIRQILNQR